MGLFQKKIGPVFLKETSSLTEYMNQLENLLEQSEGTLKKEIEKQIKFAQYGEAGEKNVAFELKSSGMDMYVLHDIYLEAGELSAQIDYIVITRNGIYILECKNLIGNIEIDNSGCFIRNYEFSGKKIKEGIYSPVTQNQRHLQVIKELRKSSKNNFLSKLAFERNFEKIYRPLVVLANPKTYLNARYARKEIKEQVIRADQLIAVIKKMDAANKDYSSTNKEMLELAQFFLNHNQPNKSDYARKYEEILAEIKQKSNADSPISKNTESEPKHSACANMKKSITENADKEVNEKKREEQIGKLKKFRLEQARTEKIKPYYIFNDAQMNDLIAKCPANKEELLTVSGFGPVKTEKYGDSIIKILQEE